MTSNSTLRMRRNCNLELRLSPSSSNQTTPHTNQQLTIFYNGRICVCDVTDLQARAILMLATRETEEKSTPSPNPDEASSPVMPPQSQSQAPTTPGLSMKRSLQRFLQKRKHRVQATSPYNNHE